MSDLEVRYHELCSRIAEAAVDAGRDAKSVTLIAVSKKQPVEMIRALYELGHRDFGENYVQELVAKAETLAAQGCDEIRWHLIGHLQSNKARAVIRHVFSVHSVDSGKIAAVLAREWDKSGRSGSLAVFLEVNISAEESKSGLAPTEVNEIVESVDRMPSLALQGLMCVPSAEETPERLAARFEELRALERGLGESSRGQLSMGMSGDFELAIRHGATHVRVGTALFGSRS